MAVNGMDYLTKLKELQAIQAKNLDICGFSGDNQGKHTSDQTLDIPFYTHTNNQKTFLNRALDLELLATDGIVTGSGYKTLLPTIDLDRQVKNSQLDWLSITIPALVFDDGIAKYANELDRQNAIVRSISQFLTDVFGFGVSHANTTGRNFYESSYTLQHNAGLVCIGGQAGTVMLVINGTGCTYGKHGWQGHLYAWLKLYGNSAKITRADIAHDLIDTEYDIYWFDLQDDLGRFSRSNRKPKVEKRGNWKRPNGKGLTLYIGSRESSIFCRIYEKGKQLGDVDSNWLRVEVEIKADTVHIPFEILLEPEKYFVACYPCLADFVENVQPKKLEIIQKENLISWQKAIEITKKQYGRYLYAFRDVIQDDKLLLDILTDIENKSYPERLDKLTIPPM